MSQLQQVNPAQTYEEYFVPGIFARWAPVLLEHAAPRPGERVLDVACGTGIVARSVAPLVGSGGRVVALDISPGMLMVARSLPKPPGATIEWKEGEAGALPDEEFDLVLCQQGLQFFPDREKAVREMRRVLAPGGRLVLSAWRGPEHHAVYRALFEAEARHLGVSVESVATPFLLGDAEIRQLLDAAGFRSVEIVQASRTVRFPSPDRFVALTLMAAAAVMPEYGELDEAARSSLVEAVSREIEGTLQQYVEGEEITFPMHSNIVVARA